jgi:TctA family transporter
MYAGVLAVGTIGAFIARFKPKGMARAFLATALAQALVAVIAVSGGFGSGGFGSTDPSWPLEILLLTGFFAALWLISAWLFRKAAPQQTPAGAAQ